MNKQNSVPAYTAAEFKSENKIKWCPGCGDFGILNAFQKALAQTGRRREDVVTVSGIGCSSRLPYYMANFGFHTIHGRAPAIASGIKIANPRLSVWNITGDGDALAIGGNHIMHLIRRNMDVNVLLFNNQIYGLTKGQYSPTSERGKATKTSPFGTTEDPFVPGTLFISMGLSLFARTFDTNMKLTEEVCTIADAHQGTAVVEVLQNCIIFNDAAHNPILAPSVRKERCLFLKHGEPMIFGENEDKGIVFQDGELKVVKIGENGITEKNLLVHDQYMPSPYLHQMIADMTYPNFPVALGVIRQVKREVYDRWIEKQIAEVQASAKYKTIEDLFLSGDTWEVE